MWLVVGFERQLQLDCADNPLLSRPLHPLHPFPSLPSRASNQSPATVCSLPLMSVLGAQQAGGRRGRWLCWWWWWHFSARSVAKHLTWGDGGCSPPFSFSDRNGTDWLLEGLGNLYPTVVLVVLFSCNSLIIDNNSNGEKSEILRATCHLLPMTTSVFFNITHLRFR